MSCFLTIENLTIKQVIKRLHASYLEQERLKKLAKAVEDSYVRHPPEAPETHQVVIQVSSPEVLAELQETDLGELFEINLLALNPNIESVAYELLPLKLQQPVRVREAQMQSPYPHTRHA